MPEAVRRWHLTGAGLESLTEVTIPRPQPGPDQLLARHDACGICFSDIKIIDLGPEHPRLLGRDMEAHPVVMGHEVALTVVGVGDQLGGKFQIGRRFIVQADVYYKGKNPVYGYPLENPRQCRLPRQPARRLAWQSSLFDQYAKTQGLTPDEVRAKYESQVPLGRGCTHDDVANAVVFLASDDASYVTGQAINVTGGQGMR